MVVICLLGDHGVGKTSLLQSTIHYLSDDMQQYWNKYVVHKEDFSGEAIRRGVNNEIISSTTLHPNRVIIGEYDSNRIHHIYSVGGHYSAIIVKMSIITISKLSDHIIFVVSPDVPLESQFEYFEHLPFTPKELYVCINKMDLFENNGNLNDSKTFENKIDEYLKEKTVRIKEFFHTCGHIETAHPDLITCRENGIHMFINIISK